ncbi:small GTP-binding protein domain-containing protein [Acetitomaculum ruminis DSM 5522]|uniref:Small GTP-binding protein domain-containing protein n=1 Tax=Acetitomaculum ruminis DSM 5522 TaxID=1120918 RepID=A0A1I0WVJ9_9FIRM|nr:TetM/TetW/TetO/TetS family tetracycline resistance ribosomal protection protein [Acetitomaculum ruminis]SFA92437.1 small GTP-binding protein domain-containing protein [Acetitomaculum ruminis DSM 5522]
MKQLAIGILAHVDAGKTTLSESILFKSNAIRKAGRVDKGDAFLDTYEMEKKRGITIFSKEARFSYKDMEATIVDTPGHNDFSPEMERTLQILDMAILIISGADGITGQTKVLSRLLKINKVPTLIFANKMDQNGVNKENLLNEIKEYFGDGAIDFSREKEDEFYEEIACLDENILEDFLEKGCISNEIIASLIEKRKLFPVFFGSALKMEGIEELLEGIYLYSKKKEYPKDFGARVYKISRDKQNNRLTHLKITGGTLKVRDLLKDESAPKPWENKVTQIRLYSGDGFEAVNEVMAGTVCAVTGLENTFPNEGLGFEKNNTLNMIEPYLSYKIILPKGENPLSMFKKLGEIMEEEPSLSIEWIEETQEIIVKIMGEVQIEILNNIISDRFDLNIEFGSGTIVYKETIEEPVVGIGHFEPLRHYAHVNLLLEPLEEGSGMEFDTDCREELLAKNWQRLILTHLKEKEHVGVLTGSKITDMKITVIGGKAHEKHTEGGDFRQATYRAVRQGLKKAKSRLLEPYYDFNIQVPLNFVGRVMTDMEKMYGKILSQETVEDKCFIYGKVPVSTMEGYQSELLAYTKNEGIINLSMRGYGPCHNEEEVIEKMNYDSELDLKNPTGSIYCSHGAGIYVPWYDMEAAEIEENEALSTEITGKDILQAKKRALESKSEKYSSEDLDEIFNRTFRSDENRKKGYNKKSKPVVSDAELHYKGKKKAGAKEYLLVDGYNIIYAWDELRQLSEVSFEAARGRLMDILSNYQGYKNCSLILVFDAYKVEGGREHHYKYNNIHVVYTKEAETADAYIEKTAHEIGHKYNVTVATSDGVEQVIIRGQGCELFSARDFEREVKHTLVNAKESYELKQAKENVSSSAFKEFFENNKID